jgi:hypothetical protein
MPRGIKGSGKGRKPAGEPGRPRRRGRKRKEALPEVGQPVELPPAEEHPAEEAVAEPLAAEPTLDEGPAPPAPDLLAQPPELAAAEAELARKYPHVRIKPGSLRVGGTEGWGNKRIITILCINCNAERTLATSDLFHVRHCQACAKADKKAARKVKKREQGR